MKSDSIYDDLIKCTELECKPHDISYQLDKHYMRPTIDIRDVSVSRESSMHRVFVFHGFICSCSHEGVLQPALTLELSCCRSPLVASICSHRSKASLAFQGEAQIEKYSFTAIQCS